MMPYDYKCVWIVRIINPGNPEAIHFHCVFRGRILASKYNLYLPTTEELVKEIDEVKQLALENNLQFNRTINNQNKDL